MLDFSAIQDLTTLRTNEAIAKQLQPCIIDHALVSILRLGKTSNRVIPFLGYYVPTCWARSSRDDVLFVDTSGFGAPDEPALTWEQLAEVFEQHLGQGVGIVEAGEFQACLAIYTRKEANQ